MSNYVFTDHPDGFDISAEDRETVCVRLRYMNKKDGAYNSSHHWVIRHEHDSLHKRYRRHAELLSFRQLLKAIAYGLYDGYEMPIKHTKEGNVAHWYGVHDWAKDQTAKALNHRVLKRWKRLLDVHYDHYMLSVIKRLFSVAYRMPDSQMIEYLFDHRDKDPYLISDIMNYRAAVYPFLTWVQFTEEMDGMLGYRIREYPSAWENVRRGQNIKYSEMWMYYYTDRHPNTALRKTLMSLPAQMSARSLYYLRRIRLERPIYSRKQLTWACELASVLSHIVHELPILYTTDDDLCKAVNRFRDITEDDGVKPNRTYSYYKMAQYLYDTVTYAGRDSLHGHTTVNAAIQFAHEQHIEMARLDRMSVMNQALNVEKETAHLPKPLNIKGIAYLDTVGAVYEEGRRMEHCVGGYADSAVRGDVYLFHVNYRGKEATVALSHTGRVLQAYGPRNKVNIASRHGTKALAKWAVDAFKHKVEKKSKRKAAANLDYMDYAALPF